MTTLREHALTIKGFLQASNAPADMLAAMHQIIDALTPSGVTITMNSRDIAPQSIAEIAQRILGRAAALPERPKCLPEPEMRTGNEVATDDRAHGGAATSGFPPSNEVEKTDIAPPVKQRKPRPPMSDEERAAKSAMMKALHASGKLKGGRRPATPPAQGQEEDGEQDEDVPPASPVRRVVPTDIMGERLIDVKPNPEWNSAYRAPHHNGYAGKREDGQLQPGDLVDIRDMLDKRMSKEEIAGLYSVGVDVLDEFLERHGNAKITKVKPPPFAGAVRRF